MDETRKKVTGPEPERLKLKGNWEVIMKKTLQKQCHAGGWPKPLKKAAKK